MLKCLDVVWYGYSRLGQFNKPKQLHGGGRLSQGKSSGDIRSLRMFLLRMHYKKLFDLENECQGHRVQHLRWCHSMVNIDLDKTQIVHFYDSSHRLRNISISNMLPLKFRSRSRNKTFTMVPFDDNYQPL